VQPLLCALGERENENTSPILQHAYNLYGKLIFKGIHLPELVSTVVEHLPQNSKVVGLSTTTAAGTGTVRDK
jgi:hypothetical protein